MENIIEMAQVTRIGYEVVYELIITWLKLVATRGK